MATEKDKRDLAAAIQQDNPGMSDLDAMIFADIHMDVMDRVIERGLYGDGSPAPAGILANKPLRV